MRKFQFSVLLYCVPSFPPPTLVLNTGVQNQSLTYAWQVLYTDPHRLHCVAQEFLCRQEYKPGLLDQTFKNWNTLSLKSFFLSILVLLLGYLVNNLNEIVQLPSTIL